MPAPDRAVVFTDGACQGNPGPGGWAWIRTDGPWAAGFDPATTNQRMELSAVLEAVRATAGPLHVVSDSTYVVNCFRDRWWEGWLRRGWVNSAKKPVANRDLWEPLIELVREGDVTFEWVKGHAGDRWNDLADRLAVRAATLRRGDTGSTTPEISDDLVADDPGRRHRDGAGSNPSTPPGAGGDPTGRNPPVGRMLVIGGQRSGTDAAPPDRIRRIREIVEAKAQLHPDLVVVSGLRAGAELDGALAALDAGARLVAVLPYPDPAQRWPSELRERFETALAGAEEVIVLQAKVPVDREAARGALLRRDAWLARHAHEALVVWDHDDPETGIFVTRLRKALGDDDVWILDQHHG